MKTLLKNINLAIVGIVFTAGSVLASSTYYDGKIFVNADNPTQYGGGVNSFTASTFDVTLSGNADNLPWLLDWKDTGSKIFTLGAGETFTFSGHYNVGDNTSPSFGMYLVNMDSVSGNNASAIGFLMNTAAGLRVASGTGLFDITKGGNNGGWVAQSAITSALNNDFILSYTAANGATAATLAFTVGTYTYTLNNAPDWENLGIAFRVYNAYSTLTLNNFDYDIIASIPEPSTFALLGVGAGLLFFLRRRKA